MGTKKQRRTRSVSKDETSKEERHKEEEPRNQEDVEVGEQDVSDAQERDNEQAQNEVMKEEEEASEDEISDEKATSDDDVEIEPADDEDKGEGGSSEEEDEEGVEQMEEDEENESETKPRSKENETKIIQKPVPFLSDGRYRNKQRCLVISSRGVIARYRHLLEDLRTLIPHHKKDAKLDPGKGNGSIGRAVNEIAEVKECNTVVFLECRKKTDAYLWLGYTPNGPSAKFHLWNVHTMDELRLTGNCLKGSRPVLTFDDSFSKVPFLTLLKPLFVDIFGTPRGHPKSKPFIDRVMGFYYADKKIWVRNYQILEEQAANAKEATKLKKGDLNTTLVEIGPRFVLNPIRIFSNSFFGQTLYRNNDFVSPNEIRAQQKREKGMEYMDRKNHQRHKRERDESFVVPEDPLANVFR